MRLLDDVCARLENDGLDAAAVREHALTPLITHLEKLGAAGELAGWLPPIERYVRRVVSREGASAWSATHFVVPPLLDVAHDDLLAFEALLDAAGAALGAVEPRGRLEQHGLRAAAEALAKRPNALLAALRALPVTDDPGWFVQLLVPPLARLAVDDAPFVVAFEQLCAFARQLSAGGVHVGYPVSVGLAALLERHEGLEALPAWLKALHPLLRAAGRDAYGLCEYGVSGLARGGLDTQGVTDALTLALSMLDHELPPGPTLQALYSSLHLDVATTLANEGVDPQLVITNGLAVFDQLGWLDDGGERLSALAIAMHRHGLRVPLLFGDGLEVLVPLERDWGGLAAQALELIEAMVRADLDPGVVMRWSLPRTLSVTAAHAPWAPAETLRFTRQLVEHGIAPEAAVSWAVRPLVELAGGVDAFRRLADAVVKLVVRLHALGVDHREVLFHDVGSLAQAGAHSHAFVELLDRVAALLDAWASSGLDPGALLGKALPTAAREATGKPWVLAIALEAATRLGREGRSGEALALLEVGISTVSKAAPDRADDFRAALSSLEGRYAVLPREVTAPASSAACALAGTDVHRLDLALEVITAAHRRHGAALVTIAPSLPHLATIAGSPEALPALIDAAIACEGSVVALVASCCVAQPELGERALTAVAQTLLAHPSLKNWVPFAARLHRLTTPDALPVMLEQLRLAFDGHAERELLESLLLTCRDRASFDELTAVVPPLLRAPRGPLIDGLRHAVPVLQRHSRAWGLLVAPALGTTKQHAGPLLRALAAFSARHLETDGDLLVLRELVTQRGVRAVDLLWNLLLPALSRGTMPSLSAHRELLERYLRDVGYADAEVYRHFVALAGDETALPSVRAARIAALRGQIDELTRAVASGELTEAQLHDPLVTVATQHVFPPSISATRAQYEWLLAEFSDRPGDVQALLGDGPATHTLEVAAGSWQLREDVVDRAPFAWLHSALPSDETPTDPPLTLGWELLSAWAEGRLGREAVRADLTRRLLRHLPEEDLPGAQLDTAAQLQAVRQLAADHLMAQVERAVLAARASDLDRVERLIRSRLAPPPRVGAGLVKGVAKTVRAMRERTLDATVGAARLRGQLQAFELDEPALARLLAADDLEPALRALRPRPVTLEPGKELARIHGELAGQAVQQMSAVLARSLEWRASSDVLRLQTTVTKRRAHAAIGLTEGVCVAVDRELWNTPTFSHLALWHEGVCVGGVHLLVVAEAGSRWLVLPGINPTLRLLDAVEADVLLKALLAHAQRLAHLAGLAGVWVPVSSAIHSNRHAISDALRALGLPTRQTQGHAFSFSPYAYRIDEVYELTPPSAG